MAGLRQSLAVGRRVGEVVALQQGDQLEVVGQDAGRQHPGHASPDDHGVAAGEGLGRWIGGTERRVHLILLVSEGVSQDLRDCIIIPAPLVGHDSAVARAASQVAVLRHAEGCDANQASDSSSTPP